MQSTEHCCETYTFASLLQDTKKELDSCTVETELARKKFLKEKVRLEVLNELVFSKLLHF